MLAMLAVTLLDGNATAWSIMGKDIKGSGDLETREFDLNGFDEISVGGAFDVSIRFSAEQKSPSPSMIISGITWS